MYRGCQAGRAISGGRDGTVRWWNTEDGTCLAIIERQSVARNVALTADGLRAVSGDHDGTLRVWDTDTGVPAHAALYERMDITGLVGITKAQGQRLRRWARWSGAIHRHPCDELERTI